ncbi:MAG: glycosyltransferase family 2 protein [Bacilli bacterium]|nr:glycosyltransferase family 2 protein [Bacilli bacterium]
MKTGITCIILTKNEENNIENCIKSIINIAERIVVVDSGSTDKTIDIAKKYNCDIYFHEFVSYAHQQNWALDNTSITTKWVYRIDADEVVTPALEKEILDNIQLHSNDDITGFVMKFKIFFLGKLLKHAGNYPFLNLVIWKYGHGRFSERYMGEHVILSDGKSITLKNYCEHHDCKSIDSFISKHNWYATREVIDFYERNGLNETKTNLYENAKKTQKLRDGFYYKMPYFFRAKMYYIYRYIIKLGFLDGKAGKAYCWLQAYWYRFVVDTKLLECKINGTIYQPPGSLK